MWPVIWTIPWLNWDIPGYGLMLMLALLGSIMWAARRGQRSGADPDVILNCGFLAVFGGVGGARAMHVIHNWHDFERLHGWQFFSTLIDLTKGGLEVYGGVIATTVLVTGYLLLWRHSVRWYLDIIAPSAALGMAIGRLGCFLNGCCWGGTCDMPWAVQYPYGSPPQQHYAKGPPKQELPKELIFEVPSVRAEALSREEVFAPPAELERAKQVVEGKVDRIVDFFAKRDAAVKAGKLDEVTRLSQELATALGGREKIESLQRSGIHVTFLSPKTDYTRVAVNLAKYNLTPAELRAIALRPQNGSPHLHPAQVYSFVGLTLLALALNALYWRRARDGYVIGTLLIVEPIARWTLEIIRTDSPHDTFQFTISQFIAMAMVAVGIVIILVCRALPPRSPAARIFVPPDDAAPAGGAAQKAS